MSFSRRGVVDQVRRVTDHKGVLVFEVGVHIDTGTATHRDGCGGPSEPVEGYSAEVLMRRTHELYILTGQSNAGGNGLVSELSQFKGERGQTLDAPQNNVLFSVHYHDGNSQTNPADPLVNGAFEPLVPGQTELNGGHPDLFGLEVSFLDRMQALRPGPVALMKYFVNGASLDGPFNPDPQVEDGGACRGLLSSIDAAAAWLGAHDGPFAWKGMIWFQGETDAEHAAMAAAYQGNLARLIARVRDHTGECDLPVLIYETQNRTASWTPIVQAAQANVAASDPEITLVDTTPQIVNMRDHVHYNAPAHVAFGKEGATQMHELLLAGKVSQA